MEADDVIATAMLALAESLRILNPPRIKMAVKCARGALKLPNISPAMTANIHLQLGKLLVFYTDNHEMARESLEEAYCKMLEWGEYLLPLRLEALQLLCDVYTHGIVTVASSHRLMGMIKSELPFAEGNPQLKCKLLMYFIEAAANSGMSNQAIMGCDSAILTFHGNNEMELYFRITKALMYLKLHDTYLTEHEHEKIHSMINALDPQSPYHLNMKLYFDSVQLAMLLYEGKTRSARSILRNIQTGASQYADNMVIQMGMRWMDHVSMTAFACLMTIANSGYQSNSERINRYFALIVRHVNEYLTKTARSPCDYGVMRSIQRIRCVANEFAAHAHILACKPSDAMNNMRDIMLFTSNLGPQVPLAAEFAPVIQNLLGLHCIYLRDYDLAEKHFYAALNISPNQTNKNAIITINTNLCLLYLSQCKHAEYYSIAENLVPNKVDSCTLVVRANVKFALALHMLLTNKLDHFKNTSEEALNYAKAEDMFRLHNLLIMTCSLVLPVGVDALHSCINWGTKGLDYMILNWTYETLAKAQRKNREDSADSEKKAFEARERLDRNTLWASHNENVAHILVNWLDGDPHLYLPQDKEKLL